MSAADTRGAGLVYAYDDAPGIRRIRAGKGFRYLYPDGRSVRAPKVLQRIRSLAIPPAYLDVWISPDPRGHIQATGRDARGRKQYRYHPRWRAMRDEVKFHRMVEFARRLPKIRRQARRDLSATGLPRRKVLALVVSLLESTCIRVGNEEYVRANDSFGLTTLRDRHLRREEGHPTLSFVGKRGKRHQCKISDPRLARLLLRCQALPGERLFQYVDQTDGLYPSVLRT